MLKSITINFTKEDHEQAESAAKKEISQPRIEQQYRNILALLAGKTFLQTLGFESKLDSSIFDSSLEPEFSNSQNLYLPNFNKFLQCYPISRWHDNFNFVLPNHPPQLGHLFIEIDTPYTTAEIIGFLPKITSFELNRSTLKRIDLLLEDIILHSGKIPTVKTPVLRDWLDGLFKDWHQEPELLERIKYLIDLISDED